MSEPVYWTATVLGAARITPSVQRVSFRAPGYRSSGCLDEWVQIFFGEPGDHSRRRNYTIRAIRPAVDEVDIDFVLHDGGLAATWAQSATPGQDLVWAHGGGSYDPPADTDWRLLAGDITALPAIGRIVEELPADAKAIVVAETVDRGDRQQWQSAGDVEAHWLHPSGGGGAASRLEQMVRAFPEPPGHGYIWMAGETRTVRATRRYLRHERRLDRARYAVTGYWLADSEQWEARYAPLAAEMEAIWTRGEAEGRDLDTIIDEYDRALERAGL